MSIFGCKRVVGNTAKLKSRLGCFAGLVITGSTAGVVLAQSAPAGGGPPATAPTTSPATQPSPEELKAKLAAAAEAIQAERWIEAESLLKPLAPDPAPGSSDMVPYEVLINLGGVYDGLVKETSAKQMSPGEQYKQDQEYRANVVKYYLRAASAAAQSDNPRIVARVPEIYQRVLRYQPRHPVALLLLARAKRDGGSPAEARNYYEDYVKTPQGQMDYDAQVELGKLLVAGGLWRQAIVVLEKVSRLGVAEADRQLARAYLTGKKPEQAMAAAQRAIEREPQNPDSLLVRAGLLLSANDPGRTQQAMIEQTQRAMTDAAAAARFALRNIEASPEDEAVQRKLPEYQANCESIIGVVRSQIRQALAGAKLTDLDPALFVGLSQLISLKGDLARKVADYEALSLLKQAAKPEQAGIVILLELADRQVALGHAGEAVATAERILKINPANEQAKKIVDSAGKPASK